MDGTAFIHALNGTNDAPTRAGPGGAVVYSNLDQTIVKPIQLTLIEKRAVAFTVTYIYKQLHTTICNDLREKIKSLQQPESLPQILGSAEDRRDLYLLGVDEVEFNSNDSHYLSFGLEQLQNKDELLEYLKSLDFSVFEFDIVKNSQIFYKVCSTLYSRMNDARGLELLNHIQGMWGLGHILCHFDGRPRCMGRTNAAPPRIVDSVWVEEPISEDEVNLDQWTYASNILKTIAIMPIEVVYSGLNVLAYEYGENYGGIRLIYNALFFHPVFVQFWTDLFSYHYEACMDKGQPPKLTFNEVFPPGIHNGLDFSRDATLTQYLNELYMRFGIPIRPASQVAEDAVFNPMHLQAASMAHPDYRHFYGER